MELVSDRKQTLGCVLSGFGMILDQKNGPVLHFHTKTSTVSHRTERFPALLVSILQREQRDVQCPHVRQTLTQSVAGFCAVQITSLSFQKHQVGTSRSTVVHQHKHYELDRTGNQTSIQADAYVQADVPTETHTANAHLQGIKENLSNK